MQQQPKRYMSNDNEVCETACLRAYASNCRVNLLSDLPALSLVAHQPGHHGLQIHQALLHGCMFKEIVVTALLEEALWEEAKCRCTKHSTHLVTWHSEM